MIDEAPKEMRDAFDKVDSVEKLCEVLNMYDGRVYVDLYRDALRRIGAKDHERGISMSLWSVRKCKDNYVEWIDYDVFMPTGKKFSHSKRLMKNVPREVLNAIGITIHDKGGNNDE